MAECSTTSVSHSCYVIQSHTPGSTVPGLLPHPRSVSHSCYVIQSPTFPTGSEADHDSVLAARAARRDRFILPPSGQLCTTAVTARAASAFITSVQGYPMLYESVSSCCIVVGLHAMCSICIVLLDQCPIICLAARRLSTCVARRVPMYRSRCTHIASTELGYSTGLL